MQNVRGDSSVLLRGCLRPQIRLHFFLKELQRSSESDPLQRSASYATAEKVRDGTDEIFTIRRSAARVNMENCERASSAIMQVLPSSCAQGASRPAGPRSGSKRSEEP